MYGLANASPISPPKANSSITARVSPVVCTDATMAIIHKLIIAMTLNSLILALLLNLFLNNEKLPQ